MNAEFLYFGLIDRLELGFVHVSRALILSTMMSSLKDWMCMNSCLPADLNYMEM